MHESLTEAFTVALRERLARVRDQQRSDIVARLRRLSAWYMALPVQDPRTPDEIIGYDQHGRRRERVRCRYVGDGRHRGGRGRRRVAGDGARRRRWSWDRARGESTGRGWRRPPRVA